MPENIRWSALPPKTTSEIILYSEVRSLFAERGFRLDVDTDGKFTAHAGTSVHSFGTLAAAREWFHARHKALQATRRTPATWRLEAACGLLAHTGLCKGLGVRRRRPP